ncbi:protein kinase [Streptomyces sp. NPDC002463]|uniref:serine/threonine-protein kinase n=1 Tax=Streptomyces sp. NPDC002463 TaxID=3364645 RepID=UPI003683D2AE
MALRDNDPREIGGHVLLDRLGSGGMGTVFLARSESGRPVALKIVHEQFAADAEFRTRFRQEVRAARRVSGAFTAPVVDADPDAARPWMATAYVPGRTLRDRVESEGPLSGTELRVLAVGLVEALRELHQVRVIHRDLKPDNVLLTEDGPRVIDFGISRAPDHQTLTVTGRILGTPPYMSPEQLSTPHRVTPASDVFSLGAVLVYATTGRGPFDAGSPYMTAYNVVHEPPEIAELSGTVREIVQWCLTKEPGERPGPEDLLGAFRAAPEAEWGARPELRVAEKPPAPTETSRPHRHPRRRPLLVALATAVALVAGTGAYAVWPDGTTPDAVGGTRGSQSPTSTGAGPTVPPRLPSIADLTASTAYLPVEGGAPAAPFSYADTPQRRPEGWRAWSAGSDLGPCVFVDASLVCTSRTSGNTPTRLVRLDAATGKELWSVRVVLNRGEFPAVVDGMVVVPTPQALKGFRLADGGARWTLPTREKPLQLTADAARAYASLVDGTLLAVNPRDGRQAWRRPVSHSLYGGSHIRVADGAVVTLSAENATAADALVTDRVNVFAAADGAPLRTTRLSRPCDPLRLSVVRLQRDFGSYVCHISSPQEDEPGYLVQSIDPQFGPTAVLTDTTLRSPTVSDRHMYALVVTQRPSASFSEVDVTKQGGPVWQVPLGITCGQEDPPPIVTGQRAYVLCGARGVVVDLTRHAVVSRFALPSDSERAGGDAWNFLVAGALVFAQTDRGWCSLDPYAVGA